MKAHVPSISKIVVIWCCTDLKFSSGALKSFKITTLDPRRSPSLSSRMVSRLWRIISQGWFHSADLTFIHVKEYRSSILQNLWFIASKLGAVTPIKILKDGLHFINYRRINIVKNSGSQRSKERASNRNPRAALCVLTILDQMTTSAILRYVKFCSCNSHSHNELCVVFRLFSLKHIVFLASDGFWHQLSCGETQQYLQ